MHFICIMLTSFALPTESYGVATTNVLQKNEFVEVLWNIKQNIKDVCNTTIIVWVFSLLCCLIDSEKSQCCFCCHLNIFIRINVRKIYFYKGKQSKRKCPFSYLNSRYITKTIIIFIFLVCPLRVLINWWKVYR